MCSSVEHELFVRQFVWQWLLGFKITCQRKVRVNTTKHPLPRVLKLRRRTIMPLESAPYTALPCTRITVNRGKAKHLKSCIKPQIIVVASPHEQFGYLFSGFPLSLPTSRSAPGGSSVQYLRHWWYSLNGQSPTSRYQTYILFKQLRPWTKIETDFTNRILSKNCY